MGTSEDLDALAARASRWGIDTEHYDGLGRRWIAAPETLSSLLSVIAEGPEPPLYPSCEARPAYQGSDALPQRSWALAVQLYSLRSARNWGHGDFTDLLALIDIAGESGAVGIGLNPLHVLFDDRADEASPYFPSSRFFLNPLYIDVEAIPEYRRDALADLQPGIETLRAQEMVDYRGVAWVKQRALALAYDAFCESAAPSRKEAFEQFRNERAPLLGDFAAFEVLRHRFDGPWWQWPQEWREPDGHMLNLLRTAEDGRLRFIEFVQWVAHEQLDACRQRAVQRGLPLGLYLDVAVGVRADGFDAWNDQSFISPALEIGAPPDALNTQGQRWGLAGFNPFALVDSDCHPFREVLRASMRYAGAIRLDHVLGLKRFYLIPRALRADQGAYVHFPFEALLEATAEESLANRCIVIGEDLGTVPPGFRDTLAAWGLWSYQVMMFQRAADGGFIAPDLYAENALVTFATHDLATFAGWSTGHDLMVKRGLQLDPGESDEDRAAAKAALQRTMAWRGLPEVDLPSVIRFLAETPSRLLVVNIEDMLGVVEQVNVPGTVDEHPNWRRRLPVPVEAFGAHQGFVAIADLLRHAGRAIRPS